MPDDFRPAPNRRDTLAATTFLSGANAAYLESLQAAYYTDPGAVDPEMRAVFDSLADGRPVSASWRRVDWPAPTLSDWDRAALSDQTAQPATPLRDKVAATRPGASEDEIRAATLDSIRAIMLIRAYRVRGHRAAALDPLELHAWSAHPELDPQTYGFTEQDLNRPIFINYVLGLETATLREILEVVRRTYCGTIGVQFMHIPFPDQKSWIQERIEGRAGEINPDREGKKAVLQALTKSEGFERFLHTKYQGTKRFGLDGGESLIPALEEVIRVGADLGVRDVILGMPHRGRLNVLANVMGKPYRAIFSEFGGGSWAPDDVEGSGDVKYHLGASSDREMEGGSVHLSLTANPSHLEAVNPVVLGKARAKQERYVFGKEASSSDARDAVLPILLHGDAAFAGQGVVAECFGLSGAKGHRTGGAIHFIVNNQIGFTTSAIRARLSPYPTDAALICAAPIFHVNGDDPEAVIYVARLAIEFRQRFQQDVVVDIFCYRRFGHNEGDEPSFTQPIMYDKIRRHESVRSVYVNRLVKEGAVTRQEADDMDESFRRHLDEEFDAGKAYRPNKADWLDGVWSGLRLPDDDDRKGVTGVDMDRLTTIGRKLTHIPDRITPHKTIRRIMKARETMIETGEGIDWATAESLAFGTLLAEGTHVRLCGQDSSRGTFSQRHSEIVDQKSEERHAPLNHLGEGQAPFEVIDSMLSEFAVLGFEYGYSLADPNSLVLWEAQFGDFANGAQVIIDQFISSGERKWLRMSGLVMLLPHGYEGQGPEHSSARLERFLQMCAEDNMQVANCTTPANYFHILRRQLRREFRKPLILMTPKSLLRHKRCVSQLVEMGPGTSFHRVLFDDAEHGRTEVKLKPDSEIKRVVMCSGKVYYDLLEDRDRRGRDDVYLLRCEQFYPVPVKSLMTEMRRFKDAEIVWCQEEPRNMGAWTFMEPNIEYLLDRLGAKHRRPRYAGRPPAASPATGLASKHKFELETFLEEALG